MTDKQPENLKRRGFLLAAGIVFAYVAWQNRARRLNAN